MRIVVAYRGIPGRRRWETGSSLVRAFRALGHDAQPYAKTYRRDEWMIPSWTIRNADLLVHLECNDGDAQYADLGDLRCPRVYWEFDTAMHLEQTSAWIESQRFARVFMANRALAPRFVAAYLPYAFDDELMRPGPRQTRDIAIVGSAFPERQVFADALNVPLMTGLFGTAYTDAISSLFVHVHHYDSGGRGLIVARPWETMGLGTCLLAPRTPELEELFQDGVHCVMYDDVNDARAKLAALRDSPSRAFEIGGRAREEILAKHTYRHRAQSILAALERK